MIIDKPLVQALVEELNPLLKKNFLSSLAVPQTIVDINIYIRTYVTSKYEIDINSLEGKMSLHIISLFGSIEEINLITSSLS